MREQVAHSFDLCLIVPFAIGCEDIATKEIADVHAVHRARQHLDVDAQRVSTDCVVIGPRFTAYRPRAFTGRFGLRAGNFGGERSDAPVATFSNASSTRLT